MKASASRLRAAGSALDRDQRFAAGAALALLVTMFLPWYEKSVVVAGSRSFAKDSISAFGAVSFVEAAIFLVSAGVLALVLARAEGGTFHLPGGDGTVILVAGLWASALIFFRVFDRPDVSGDGGTVGIQWGFFVAFVAAGMLAWAGHRIRAASRPAAPVREPRPSRRPPPGAADDADLGTWSEAPTAVAPRPARPDAPTAVARAEPRRRRSGAPGDAVPAEPGDVLPAERLPAGPEAPADVAPKRPRRGRDRAVRREDAQVTVDDPPDIPPRRGDAPRPPDRD